ncbi:MAG: lysylphosphatidylglycerol synthase transmembrane domain-containing protein [Crocinitomicaceae bacterium]
MKKALIAILKIVVPLGVGVYLIWYYYNQMSQEDRDTTIYAIKNADYLWLILSMLIGFVSHMSRAYRWKYTLEPMGYKPKFWHMYHGVMIGYIVNLTIPRSGEASRAGFLYNSDGIPFTKSFGTIIAERAVDLIALGIITLITIGMQYSKVDEMQALISGFGKDNAQEGSESGLGTYILIALCVMALVGIILIIVNKKIRSKIFELISGVMEGVKSIFKSKNPGGFLLHTLIIWVCYLAMFVIAFKALPSTSDMPIGGSLAAFIAGTLGLLFIPGGIGAYPALVGIITTFYLFPEHFADGETGPHPQAYAIGWLIWLAQTALIVGLGIISLLLGSMIKKKAINNEQTGNTAG